MRMDTALIGQLLYSSCQSEISGQAGPALGSGKRAPRTPISLLDLPLVSQNNRVTKALAEDPGVDGCHAQPPSVVSLGLVGALATSSISFLITTTKNQASAQLAANTSSSCCRHGEGLGARHRNIVSIGEGQFHINYYQTSLLLHC